MTKILIVDDDKLIRQSLVHFLEDQEFEVSDAGTSDEGRELLKEFEPHIVLLDLEMPRDPEDGNQSIKNAVDVLHDILFLNAAENYQIKVIIISGTIDDPGLQQLVYGDRSNVINFINKTEVTSDPLSFQEKLLKNIRRAIKKDIEPKSIEYKALRKSLVRELKAYNEDLCTKIEQDVLVEFEKLNDKGGNIHTISKNVIIACGAIVEDIISLLEYEGAELYGKEYPENPNSVRYRLHKLTGRRHIKGEGYELTDDEPVISRPASECAYYAYNFRSEAVHGGLDEDDENKKLYANKYRFTREDAAVSINLIMPLIRDYIKYLKDKD